MIEDSGIGIAPHILENLFVAYKQGDASTARLYGGTGLGLAISRQLAQLLGGTIQLDSKQGIGTKAIFDIELKLANSEVRLSDAPFELSHFKSVPTIPEADAQVTPEMKRESHILVVEDNAINQKIAIKTIQALGFPNVTAVWNGAECLSYLLSSKSRFPSLVLMDVQMPIMDGYTATHHIRHEEPFAHDEVMKSTPIIAMTASAINGDREKCHAAGMDDYLSKPVKREELEKMLFKWIRRKRTTED